MEVAVTTCRRNVDYWWMCLNALNAHRFPFPKIYYDEEQHGPSSNFMTAMDDSSGDLLVIQDDFIVTSEFGYVQRATEDYQLLSLYTHGYPESDSMVEVDCSTPLARAKNCNGGCAWYIHKETIRNLIEWSSPENINQPLPMMIGQFCNETGMPYLIAGKNIGRHIGEISSVKSRPNTFRYPLIERESL